MNNYDRMIHNQQVINNAFDCARKAGNDALWEKHGIGGSGSKKTREPPRRKPEPPDVSRSRIRAAERFARDAASLPTTVREGWQALPVLADPHRVGYKTGGHFRLLDCRHDSSYDLPNRVIGYYELSNCIDLDGRDILVKAADRQRLNGCAGEGIALQLQCHELGLRAYPDAKIVELWDGAKLKISVSGRSKFVGEKRDFWKALVEGPSDEPHLIPDVSGKPVTYRKEVERLYARHWDYSFSTGLETSRGFMASSMPRLYWPLASST